MEKVLVNPADIESCWEKPDACMVKMKTGKVWVCEKEYKSQPTIEHIKQGTKCLLHGDEIQIVQTLVELPLKRGGKYGK